MMTKKEAVQVLAILQASYPNFYKSMTNEVAQGIVSVWTMQFDLVSADIVLLALNKLIATSKFPPTIAEVKDKLTSIHWEAYEKLHGIMAKRLPDDELKLYKRIYEETAGYKYSNRREPSIKQMLGNRERVKQLEKGE